MPPSQNFAELLRAHARARPDAIAVRYPTSRTALEWHDWTFGALDRAADAYARGFAAQGVTRGDRALLLVKPGPGFYPLVFGLVRVGAVPVFIDPGMGPRQALACVERIRPRVMIGASAAHAVRVLYRRPFAGVELPITDGARWFWGGPTLAACSAEDDSPFPTAPFTASEEAVLVFTSGSTGPAKAVSLTHGCFQARVRLIQEMLGLRAGETVLETLLVYTMLEVCMGMTVVVPPMDVARPATADPTLLAATLRAVQPEVASASPVVWHNLVRHAAEHGDRFPSVRMLLTSAAPIPVSLHRRLGGMLSEGVQLFTPYGATEAMPVSLIGTTEILEHTAALTARGAGTCVGSPAPGIDIRLIRVTDEPIPTWDESLRVAPGEIGEIVVAGDGVSSRYRESPEGNAEAKIADGDRVLHRMGDLGRFDADGRLWFCGRRAHRLETRDGMVPCVPVEGIYNQHPSVRRTALVGVGAPGSQVPVLCVEPEDGKTLDGTLIEELRALASETEWDGIVTHFLAHTGFPTDTRHNSKIRREDLRAWASTRVPGLVR